MLIKIEMCYKGLIWFGKNYKDNRWICQNSHVLELNVKFVRGQNANKMNLCEPRHDQDKKIRNLCEPWCKSIVIDKSLVLQ